MSLPPFLPSILSFKSSKYKQNPEILAPLLKALHDSGDTQKVYTGFGVEDPETAVWVTLWNSPDAYEKFTTIQDGLMAAADLESPPNSSLVLLRPGDPAEELIKALGAPVTSYGELELNPELSGGYELIQAQSSEMFDKFRSLNGCVGAMRGKYAKRDNTFTFFVGWESMEAHEEAFKAGAPMKEASERLKQYSNMAFIKHVSLSSS